MIEIQFLMIYLMILKIFLLNWKQLQAISQFLNFQILITQNHNI